jgi:hypothetical protein
MDESKKIKSLLHMKPKCFIIKYTNNFIKDPYSQDVMHMEVEAFSEEEALTKFKESQSAEVISIEER